LNTVEPAAGIHAPGAPLTAENGLFASSKSCRPAAWR